MTIHHEELEQQVQIGEQIDHQTGDAPVVPVAGVVYGDMIYWGTIAASILTLIGEVMSFITTQNFMSPTYLLSSIWQGKSVEDIWTNGAAAAMPEGHWYLNQLATGDGLTTAGLALGVFTVIPAIVGSAVMLVRQRQFLYAGLALVAGVITSLALLGWL